MGCQGGLGTNAELVTLQEQMRAGEARIAELHRMIEESSEREKAMEVGDAAGAGERTGPVLSRW
jgi:hypothetical protein